MIKIFVPSLWDSKEAETVDLGPIHQQLMTKLSISGASKMKGPLDMNQNSVKNVDDISSSTGNIQTLEANSLIIKERCVVPTPKYSSQATPRSYVDKLFNRAVKPAGSKIHDALTMYNQNGRLISSQIKINDFKNLADVQNLTCKKLMTDNIEAATAKLSTINISSGEIKLQNGATISGVTDPTTSDSAVNKLYVDTIRPQRDVYTNAPSMITVTNVEEFFPLKHLLGKKDISSLAEARNQIQISEDSFYRIIMTGTCVTTNLNGVPNARATMYLNETEILAIKPVGNKKLSLDLIAQDLFARGSKIGIKARVFGSDTEKLYLKCTIVVEKLTV